MRGPVQLRNETRGTCLAQSARVADSFLSRLLGLMGKKTLEQGSGLVIQPAGSIHMFFMRFPIDAVFVDRDWRVLHTAEGLRPWRVTRFVPRSKRVVELPAGTCANTNTKPGDILSFGDGQAVTS